MLYTMPIVAQLIGEEPWFDLRQNRAIYCIFHYFSTPEHPSGQLESRENNAF
jgi:hypothetical protein